MSGKRPTRWELADRVGQLERQAELLAERVRSLTILLERAEQDRDAHLMRLSTCAEENAIRRRLLLEARETIARLEQQVATGAMSDGR